MFLSLKLSSILMGRVFSRMGTGGVGGERLVIVNGLDSVGKGGRLCSFFLGVGGEVVVALLLLPPPGRIGSIATEMVPLLEVEGLLCLAGIGEVEGEDVEKFGEVESTADEELALTSSLIAEG
jgi:hypothetical protein